MLWINIVKIQAAGWSGEQLRMIVAITVDVDMNENGVGGGDKISLIIMIIIYDN